MGKISKSAHVRSSVQRVDSVGPEFSRLPSLQEGGGDQFLRGPVPLDWLTAASVLPGRSLHVGIALWFLAGLGDSRVILLTNTTADRFGVDRNGKYRALDWLEGAGLIRVARRPGRPPEVTLLDTGQSDDGPP